MLDQAWIGEELEYILKTYFKNGPKLSRKLLAISGLSFGYRFRIAGAQFPQQNDLPLSASKNAARPLEVTSWVFDLSRISIQ